ncbi:MAG: family 10 glycosylhydrolase [Tunicatimonas sp.]
MLQRLVYCIGLTLIASLVFSKCREDNVIVNETPVPQRQIDYFAFEEFPTPAEGIVKNDSGIIRVTVPFGADLTALVPTIRFSDGATLSPDSGVAQDFSDFVIYTVTDPEGAQRLYTVLVEELEAPKSSDARITAINFPSLYRSGEIREDTKDILLEVGFGTDLSAVPFEAELDDAEATLDDSGTLDLRQDAGLTVTAPDGSPIIYTIRTTVLPQETGIRGVWLTNVDSEVLTSQARIEEAVALCDSLNINTIFVVTYNKAATTFPSQVMEDLVGTRIAAQYDGRDPLREVIDAAHARNIKVFAWFEYGFAAFNGSPGPILEAQPTWGAINQEGEQVVKNGFYWLNSLLPEVQDFMTDLVLEVVVNYPDIDGVQGDDRLPAMPSEGGYDTYTKSQYAAEHDGQEPPANRLDNEWLQWRADRLNGYAKDLYDTVKAINPACIVAHSPSPLNFGFTEYLQDYTAWVDGGYSDIVSPQLYRRDNQGINVYRALLLDQISRVGEDSKVIFYPGILSYLGSYVPSEDFLAEMILENRRNGITGEVHFFYNTLLVRAEVLKAMYPGEAVFPF